MDGECGRRILPPQTGELLRGRDMGKWTRRDLVKAGLAASAGVMAGSELVAEPRVSSWRARRLHLRRPARRRMAPASLVRCGSGCCWTLAGALRWATPTIPTRTLASASCVAAGRLPRRGAWTGPASPRFDDSAWRKVDLPHDWAVELPFVNNRIADWARRQAAGARVSGDERGLVSPRICVARERRGTAHLGGV